MASTKTQKEKEPPDEIELDLGDRKGAYWKGWPSENVQRLVLILKEMQRAELTDPESDLLMADRILHGHIEVGSMRDRYFEDLHLSHKLPREQRKALMRKKAVVIVNKTNRDIVITMPGGSGCRKLIMPGYGAAKGKLKEAGFHVLNSYQEAFVDRQALSKTGLVIEDYDPDIHGRREAEQSIHPYVGKRPRPDHFAQKSSIDPPRDPQLIAATARDDAIIRTPQGKEAARGAIGSAREE